MKQLIITALVLMLSACASKNSVEPVNVMVLVQDDGEDSLPSSHRAVSRFIRAVSGVFVFRQSQQNDAAGYGQKLQSR